jgi:hypothetical protein
MFISTAEKEKLFSAIKSLEIRIYALEKAPVKETTQKPKRVMSAEHRAKIAAGVKAAVAKKREAKAEITGAPV